jgi:hypothetical protein
MVTADPKLRAVRLIGDRVGSRVGVVLAACFVALAGWALFGFAPATAEAGDSSAAVARASAGSSSFTEEFCEGGIVNEFGLPELPPLANPFPERPALRERQLPSFAPKTVSLELGGGPILTPGQEIGFWLQSDNFVGKTPLRWTLKDTIRAVSQSGEVGPVVAQGKVPVKYINARREVKDFLVPPRDLGAYRYDLKIESWDGTQLAEYSTYVWVEKKFWAPRLGLSAQVVHPGGLLLSRPENMGTIEFEYGEDFRLQREVSGVWTRMALPGEEEWELWLGYDPAGAAGQCSALRLPDNFSPGKYRIVKSITRTPRGKPIFLAAPLIVSKEAAGQSTREGSTGFGSTLGTWPMTATS